MTKYKRSDGDFMLAPYLPQENFGNTSGGNVQALTQNDLLPYSLVNGDLPIILPERTDIEATGSGQGRNPGAVLSSQFTPGAGAIPNVALPLMMIPRMPGNKTVTHSGAEVWTIKAVAPGNIGESSYFCFDVFDANKDAIKYQAWFDTTGSSSAPTALDCYDPVTDTDDGVNQSTTQGKRELVEIDISSASDAQGVSDAIQTALDAITGLTAANGSGSSETVTCTNDNNGAVMDAFDYNTDLTIATTTQGYDKIEVSFDPDTDELSNYFGFRYQRNNGSYDTIYDITACSIATHTLSVSSGEGEAGIMKESVNYMMGALKEQYGALTMLSKPRDAYGQSWTKNTSPFHQKHNNHSWATANGNETFTYNGSTLNAVWFGWEIAIEHALQHEFDGNGDYASGVSYNKRDIAITIDIQPEDYELFELQREHPNDYDGDVLLQLKSIIPGTSDQVYVQFDCDKCRLLPFEEKSPTDAEPERYNIELHPAPGATIKYTLQTYIPSYYYGLGGE